MKISLKAARVNANLNQQEVSDKLGVSKHTITNWETGKTKIKKGCVMALASVYGLGVEDLKY